LTQADWPPPLALKPTTLKSNGCGQVEPAFNQAQTQEQVMAAGHSSTEIPIQPLELAIVAHGTASLTPAEMDAMRGVPLSGLPATLVPQLLKHSDEQTLASLIALRRGLAGSALEGTDFDRWGVVSSSRYLGRSPFAAVLDKYKIDGPWGVSVQVIPHRMPHSVPGTMNLALLNHGPSISVGGGPDDQTSTLLSMAGLLRKGRFAGVWLVVSGWWPELTIEINGTPTSDSKCSAAVLAVVPSPSPAALGAIRFSPLKKGTGTSQQPEQADKTDSSLGASLLFQQPACSGGRTESPGTSTLADFLLAPSSEPRMWSCQFGNGMEIAVDLLTPRSSAADQQKADALAPAPTAPPPHRRASATGSRIKRGR
jgi:hypothetical protein